MDEAIILLPVGFFFGRVMAAAIALRSPEAQLGEDE
jgi:hypothetical protein